MTTHKPKTSLSLLAFHALFPDEDAARAWFEQARWPDGVVCTKCQGHKTASWLIRARRWQCCSCHHQFTVMTNTPMHKSHLPLLVWAQAMFLIASSSKGVPSMKLSEMLGISYKSAWHLSHRVRAMMAEDDGTLSGIIDMARASAGKTAPVRTRTGSDGSSLRDAGHTP